jgi:AcrR family transcriptional regulator
MAHAGYLPGPERRKQILEGAKRVFARRGYHDTNISHICDDLGIGRGTLYQYFASKRDVFSAIIEELLDRVRRFVENEPPLAIPADLKPTREQVLAFTARCLRRSLEAAFVDEASLRILVREAVGLDVQIDQILRAIDDIVLMHFTRDLLEAQRAGLVRADVDVRRAALFTLGGVQKLALDALLRSNDADAGDTAEIDLRALAEEAARLQLDGILSPGLQR